MPRMDKAQATALAPEGATAYEIPTTPNLDLGALMGMGATKNPDVAADYAQVLAKTTAWAGRNMTRSLVIGQGTPYASSQYGGSLQAMRLPLMDGLEVAAELRDFARRNKQVSQIAIEMRSVLSRAMAPMGDMVGRVAGYVAQMPVLPTDAVPVLGAIIRGWVDIFVDASRTANMPRDPTKPRPMFDQALDATVANWIARELDTGGTDPRWNNIFAPPGVPNYLRCIGGADPDGTCPPANLRGEWSWDYWSVALCRTGTDCAPDCVRYKEGGKNKARIVYPPNLWGWQYGIGSWTAQGISPTLGWNEVGGPPYFAPAMWVEGRRYCMVPGLGRLHLGALVGQGSNPNAQEWGDMFPTAQALASQAWDQCMNAFSPACFAISTPTLRVEWLFYLAGLRRGLHCTRRVSKRFTSAPSARVLMDPFCSDVSGTIVAGGDLHKPQRVAICNMYADMFGWPRWNSKDDRLLEDGVVPPDGAMGLETYIRDFKLESTVPVRALDELRRRQEYAAENLVTAAYMTPGQASGDFQSLRDRAVATLTSEKNLATLYVDLDMVDEPALRTRIEDIQADIAAMYFDPTKVKVQIPGGVSQRVLNATWRDLLVDQAKAKKPPPPRAPTIGAKGKRKTATTGTSILTPANTAIALGGAALAVAAVRAASK